MMTSRLPLVGGLSDYYCVVVPEFPPFLIFLYICCVPPYFHFVSATFLRLYSKSSALLDTLLSRVGVPLQQLD